MRYRASEKLEIIKLDPLITTDYPAGSSVPFLRFPKRGTTRLASTLPVRHGLFEEQQSSEVSVVGFKYHNADEHQYRYRRK